MKTKKEKAQFVVQTLEELFPTTPIPLDHKDAYTLLVAVLLSAQCTDERVNQITPKLFALADNPFEMSQVPVEQIQSIIRPCGLSPKKAAAISELSKILVNQYNGEVPASYEALEALPGVGHKTASVVMSQAFGFPAFPVDTHIHRLMTRRGLTSGNIVVQTRLMTRWGLTSGKNVVQTEKDAKALFAMELWNKLHLQIIFYGRAYSPARSPKLELDLITRTIGTAAAKKELR